MRPRLSRCLAVGVGGVHFTTSLLLRMFFSDKGHGVFFEGAMTRGFASEATDAAVHANIIAAGYGT